MIVWLILGMSREKNCHIRQSGREACQIGTRAGMKLSFSIELLVQLAFSSFTTNETAHFNLTGLAQSMENSNREAHTTRL
jgi:hypothetical protein